MRAHAIEAFNALMHARLALRATLPGTKAYETALEVVRTAQQKMREAHAAEAGE